MALVSTVGLGSGLDIGSLVQQLVDSERAAPTQALNRREARTKAQISALGKVNGAFSALQSAAAKLRTGTVFDGRKVTSSNTDRLAVSIAAGQTPAKASYSIEIQSLAAAQKLQSDPAVVTSATAAIGAGTLQFTVDGESFAVVVSASDTLANLASAINSAASGKVQASVISGDAGFSLSLSSGKTGNAGVMHIEQTAGGSTLSAFTYDPDAPQPGTLDQITPPSDTVLKIDGVTRTSSSTTVSDAISGLELNLKQAELGQTVTVTVAGDNSGAQTAVQGLVNAYNTALGVLRQVSAYNPDANTAEALNGDAFVRSAMAQLRNFVSDAFRAAADTGIKLGIDTDIDGSLKFDASVFNQSLAANPDAMKALYSGESAVVTSGLHGYLTSLLGEEGVLTLRTDRLGNTLKTVGKDREALDRRMLAVEERYRRQFVALDSLLGRLNSTSQYLSQQLASLPGANGGG